MAALQRNRQQGRAGQARKGSRRGIHFFRLSMTKTTPPAEDHLCAACAGIQRNWRKAPGHAELMQRGNRKEERGAAQVTVTRYVCEQCGTVWDYENNKQNQHAGWSVVGRV